ncbi:MAG TPA: GNAT family protein [Bellilinea sp.]|nr:GNAT family protein [Bellilinea sp.]
MRFDTQLFKSKNLILEAYDLETDPKLESPFTIDPKYTLGIIDDSKPKPMMVHELKKLREKQVKSANEGHGSYIFSIYSRKDKKFLGVFQIYHMNWLHGNAHFGLRIGDEKQSKKYFAESVHLALQFIFEELNQFIAFFHTAEYEPEVVRALKKEKMVVSGKEAENAYFDGRYWTKLIMTMHQSDWIKQLDKAEAK